MRIARVISLVLALLCFSTAGLFYWHIAVQDSVKGNYWRILHYGDLREQRANIDAASNIAVREKEKQQASLALAKIQQETTRDWYVISGLLSVGAFFLFRFFKTSRRKKSE